MLGLTVSIIVATASLFTAIPQTNMGFYPMTTVVTDENKNSPQKKIKKLLTNKIKFIIM